MKFTKQDMQTNINPGNYEPRPTVGSNFRYNKFNPSVNEWVNSIYTFEPRWSNKNSNLINNKLSYNLINTYFNIKLNLRPVPLGKATKLISRKKITHRLSYLSIGRIFVGIPEFKQTIQNLNIVLYIFNKEETLLVRKINKLRNLRLYNSLKKGNTMLKTLSITKYKGTDTISNYSSLRETPAWVSSSTKNKYIIIKNNLMLRYYKILLYKMYLIRLYYNKFKFNYNSLFHLKKLLGKIYNTEVNINIVKLKHLFLDNSMFVDAITRKLKDRNKNALRVLRNALILPKIPIINNLLLMNKKIFFTLFNKMPYPKGRDLRNISALSTPFLPLREKIKTHEGYNTDAIFPGLRLEATRKSIFETMKNTHVIGVRLEGKGRLTRRLTAARAVHKVTYLGSLKNVFSSFQGLSSVINKGFEKSNINYVNMNSNNRNGSFGIKSWQNTL